jgi:hypothetical protein
MKVQVPVNTTGFWLVWSPHFDAPKTRYTNIGKARSAAEALAHVNPGVSFYVMQPLLNARVPHCHVWPMQPMYMQQALEAQA